jgi:predicted ATP-grasp superfamily ATP-dependent carboligase
VEGASCSAAYIAAAGRAALIGVTQQLVGAAWTGADGYRYAGSIGPLSLEDRERDLFTRIGDCLARRFELQGLFGVDAVRTEEAIWPVEVNPRYTASMEILERALEIQAIAEHAFACREGRLRGLRLRRDGPCCGKAVVYARAPTTISCDLDQPAIAGEAERIWPSLADIPNRGTRIDRGRPLTTVFAAGRSRESVHGKLRRRVQRLQELLAC